MSHFVNKWGAPQSLDSLFDKGEIYIGRSKAKNGRHLETNGKYFQNRSSGKTTESNESPKSSSGFEVFSCDSVYLRKRRTPDIQHPSESNNGMKELHGLFLQERQKNRLFEVEIERLKKLLGAYKKKLREKNEELREKSELLKSVVEGTKINDNISNRFSPSLDVLENIDMDSLLTVNLDDDTMCTFLEGSLEDLDLDVGRLSQDLDPNDGFVTLPINKVKEFAVNTNYVMEPQKKGTVVENLMMQDKPMTIKKVSPIKICRNVKKGKLEIKPNLGTSKCNIEDKAHFGGDNCGQCRQNFEKKSTLEAHYESHKFKSPWQCAKCKKNYKNLTKFVNHVKREHGISDLHLAKEMLSTNKINV